MKRLGRLTKVDFLLALFLLIANDLFFKHHFGNWFTGKLSDFCGVYAFTVFCITIFPRKVPLTKCMVIVLFIWWKSSFSTGFIELWNHLFDIPLSRVIDLSDLIALPVVFFADQFGWGVHHKIRSFSSVATVAVTVISIFSFVATSIPMERVMLVNQDHQVYPIKVPKDSLVQMIKSFDREYDFVYHPHYRLLSENNGESQVLDSLRYALNYDTLNDVYSRFPYGKFKLNAQNEGVELELVQTYFRTSLHADYEERFKKRSERQFKRRFLKKIQKMVKHYHRQK